MIYELLKTDTIQNIVNGYQNMNITDGLKGMARTKTNDQLLYVGSQVGNMALPALWISMIIKKNYAEIQRQNHDNDSRRMPGNYIPTATGCL